MQPQGVPGGLVALAGIGTLPARAQDTPIRFQPDWRFEGPAALFLTPAAKSCRSAP